MWRIGWAISNPDLISKIGRFAGATLFGVCQFAQDGATHALENDASDVEAMRKAYQARRDFAVSRINAIAGLRCVSPPAGMFIMVDVSRLGTDGDAFARRLLDEAGVSTIPGSGFGARYRSWTRPSSELRSWWKTHPRSMLSPQASSKTSFSTGRREIGP
jgi:arginine:pyruvate transaminase